MISKLVGALVAGTSITAISIACPSPAQAQDMAFDIRPGALRDALDAYGRQSRRQMIYRVDEVRGVDSPGARGPMSADRALELLLAGTGFAARTDESGAIAIVRRDGDVAPGEGAAGDDADGQGNDIVVTGTNLRGAPASSPIIVIDREEIDRSGATSVEQLMRKLPQNSQNGVNQENFAITIPDQDVTDHGAGVNLRGLGQRATLVLLDGRRLAPSGYGAYVDVSLIPLSLIERVDILTDGASAVYGSDAVGGVVNFILRDRIEGLETSLQAGATTRGGGEQLLLSQAGGGDWNGGHGILAYEYRREDEIRAGDRAFVLGLRPDTFILPRERRHSVLASVEQALAPGLTLGATGTYAHRTTDRTYFTGGVPIPVAAHAVAESVSLAGDLTYDVGQDWRIRLEGNYGLSDTDQQQTQPGGAELANARDVRNEIFGGAVKADGPLFELPGGAVRVALGGELRRESYRDGFESSAISRAVKRQRRTVGSLFGELSVPLVSAANRSPGLERLELSAAGRFDDYGDSGSAFDPKLGILWSPLDRLNLRASYGTSFRAPLLAEIGGTYDVFYAPAYLVYLDPAEAPPGSIVALLQGSDPDIRPETSQTWSAGAEYSPDFARGLLLSVNYYSVRFTDRIALPIRTVVVVGDPAFEPIIYRDPDVAELTAIVEGARRTFDVTGPGFSDGGATPADVDILLDTRVSNTAETRTDGFDFIVRYAFETGGHQFVLDANVNHVLAFDNRLSTASPVSQSLDRVYGPPAWRARGGLAWSHGPWAGSLSVNYVDAYQDDRRAELVPVDSWTTVDLALSHDFAAPGWLQGTRVSLYVENLFDDPPPPLLPDPGSTTGLGYDPINASGRGRFVSVQLRRSW